MAEGLLFGLIAIVLIFVAALAGAVVGAFVGWVVGYTPLGTWILNVFSAFGAKELSMVEIGTTAGFIGAFFAPSHPRKD
jgi:hypothetical protein